MGANGDSAVSVKLLSLGVCHRVCVVCRVMQKGLHCIQQLTAAEWVRQPQHRGLLQAFVRAFGQQAVSPDQEPNVKAGVMKASEASSYTLLLAAIATLSRTLQTQKCVVDGALPGAQCADSIPATDCDPQDASASA